MGRLVHVDENPAIVAFSDATAADALPLPFTSASLSTERDASFMRFIDVPDHEFSAWTIEAPRHGLMQVFEVRGRTTLSASELSSNAAQTARPQSAFGHGLAGPTSTGNSTS